MNRSAAIAVCIPTLHREDGLARALESVAAQRLEGTGIDALVAIVVNNDPADRTPHATAARIAAATGLAIEVLDEPERGTAPPRNRALARAREVAALVAFLDDDEEAPERWLASLLATKRDTGAEIATGTVRSRFVAPPPAWAAAVFARPEHAQGSLRPWAFTGNVLFDASLLERLSTWFDPRFRQGEDRHFFARLAATGARIAWCASDAPVELVPPARVDPAWIARRMHAIGRAVTAIERDTPAARFAGPRNLAKGLAWIAIGWTHRVAAALKRDTVTAIRARGAASYGRGLVEGALGASPSAPTSAGG
jgi:hypothetical protein